MEHGMSTADKIGSSLLLFVLGLLIILTGLIGMWPFSLMLLIIFLLLFAALYGSFFTMLRRQTALFFLLAGILSAGGGYCYLTGFIELPHTCSGTAIKSQIICLFTQPIVRNFGEEWGRRIIFIVLFSLALPSFFSAYQLWNIPRENTKRTSHSGTERPRRLRRYAANPPYKNCPERTSVQKTLKTLTILWAWGCWTWVIYSHQWLWLIPSLFPYFLFTSFGHLLDKHDN
jgi:hypothetical protein